MAGCVGEGGEEDGDTHLGEWKLHIHPLLNKSSPFKDVYCIAVCLKTSHKILDTLASAV
jgi:hypothetical protein